jgi:hypothetical protein
VPRLCVYDCIPVAKRFDILPCFNTGIVLKGPIKLNSKPGSTQYKLVRFSGSVYKPRALLPEHDESRSPDTTSLSNRKLVYACVP